MIGFLSWPSRQRWSPLVKGGAVAAVLVAALFAAAVQFRPDPSFAGALDAARTSPTAIADWRAYGNDPGGTRFSPAALLTPDNVNRLRPAWTYRIGEVNTIGKAGLQVTPLMIGDTLYLCSSFNDIIALDAETGRERWRFRAKADLSGVLSAGCRGVAYYAVPGEHGPCAERIISSTIDARLLAVDRHTGEPCRQFGRNGAVSLLENMGVRHPGYYYTTSAPTIARGRIIVGGWVTDNQYWGEPSGVIRAFDAVTGRFSWAMDVGRPDRHDQPPVGETYTLSTPNSWSTMSVDDGLGLVYAPLGNPTPDYVGAQRRPFDEKFGSSIVAIDAETGGVRWHFQTVHHDLWDYDVASQPVLADVTLAGRPRKLLIQATKRGEIFVLDRVTGQPAVPVVERPVPQAGTAPGERVSATQPFSEMPSLRGPDLTEASMWGVSALDQLWCRIKFKEARYQGVFTPPGLIPSVTYPGALGGTNWGSLAVDPRTGRVIVNVSHVPNYTRIVPRAEANAAGVKAMRPGTEGGFGYLAQEGTPYAAQTGPSLSPIGVPCNQPPFGRVVALDLATRKIAWQHALGTARDSGPFGLRSMLPVTMGTPIPAGLSSRQTDSPLLVPHRTAHCVHSIYKQGRWSGVLDFPPAGRQLQ